MEVRHGLPSSWAIVDSDVETVRPELKLRGGLTKPHTPAPMEADCQEIFDTLRTLVATLGQPVFEPLSKGKTGGSEAGEASTFYLRSAKYDATGEYTVEGMVVLAGSKARKDIATSMANTPLVPKRQSLVDDGALKLEGDFYVFQRDVLFKSPSGAAAMVRGASSNGWVEWVSKDGKTLDELKRQAPLNKSES
jgi:hypothetical protein